MDREIELLHRAEGTMHKKLFIPGPVEVKEDVLSKMATPLIGHRSEDASNLQRDISNNLKKLFYTENEILLSTSSGTGLMEAAVRCCTKERAAMSVSYTHLISGTCFKFRISYCYAVFENNSPNVGFYII